MTINFKAKHSPISKGTLTTTSAGFKIPKRQPNATDMIIKTSNAANRGAIGQNVGASEGDNPNTERIEKNLTSRKRKQSLAIMIITIR